MAVTGLPVSADAPSRAGRKAIVTAGLGWGLDAFDFYLYVYALPQVDVAFALSKAAGGFLATQTLVASAVGGIAMGVLADRIGRKNALMISIAWYAIFTAACGLAQNYTELAVFRTLEGLGFGGEWAVGAVMAAEWSAARQRGRNLAFMQSAWALGWLLANVAYQIVARSLHSAGTWRVLFFLGILPAFALFFIRRGVEEPATSAAVRQRPSPMAILRPGLARTTLIATLLAAGVQSGYYALFTWMPSYLSSARGLSSFSAGDYLYALIGGAFSGYVSAGYVNDLLGRRLTFVIFSLCSACMVPLYLLVVTANWQLLPAGFLLGYFASGIFSGFGPLLSELFPAGVRASAQGFTYNVGRGIAGAAPFLVGLLAARVPIAWAMVTVAAVAYAVAIVAVLALPETKGRALE